MGTGAELNTEPAPQAFDRGKKDPHSRPLNLTNVMLSLTHYAKRRGLSQRTRMSAGVRVSSRYGCSATRIGAASTPLPSTHSS
jgi:hypothetical protein